MKRVPLQDVANHAIIRHQGQWGVVCRWRRPVGPLTVVDFWWQGREYVPSDALVEVPAPPRKQRKLPRPEPGLELLLSEREPMFTERCRLCGEPARGAYCPEHEWAYGEARA